MNFLNWDRVGIGLSLLCALHCLLTPLVLLSVPLLARYYLVHPVFHLILAATIIPVGLYAFFRGFKHHRNLWVYFLGVPGLLIVSAVPVFVHQLHWALNEQVFMVLGSSILVGAHWLNRRSCSDCAQSRH